MRHLLLLLVFVSSCDQSQQRAVQTLRQVRELVAKNRLEHALHVLRNSKTERAPHDNPRLARWKERDRVLFWMEEGMILFRLKRYREAVSVLHKAERRTRELYTQSMRKLLYSTFFSHSFEAYRPKPYERILLNTIKILSCLGEHDVEGAMVQAKQLDELTKYIKRSDPFSKRAVHVDAVFMDFQKEDRYFKEALRRARALNLINGWLRPVQHWDGFSFWIAGIARELSGDHDGARISYQHALTAYRRQNKVPSWLISDLDRVSASPATSRPISSKANPRTELIVLHLRGLGPVLKETKIVCGCGEPKYIDKKVWIEMRGKPLPKKTPALLARFETRRQSFEAQPGSRWMARGLEQFCVCRPEPVMQLRKPQFYVTHLTSPSSLDSAVMEIGEKKVSFVAVTNPRRLAQVHHASERERQLWRGIVRAKRRADNPNIVGLAEADKRIWSTLPARIDMARLALSPGKHHVTIQPSGKRFSVTVNPGQVRLHIVQ